jgi:hypothetical protein
MFVILLGDKSFIKLAAFQDALLSFLCFSDRKSGVNGLINFFPQFSPTSLQHQYPKQPPDIKSAATLPILMSLILTVFAFWSHEPLFETSQRVLSATMHLRWHPTAAAQVRARVWQVGFVVDKMATGQVFSEYFGFPCQPHSFH